MSTILQNFTDDGEYTDDDKEKEIALAKNGLCELIAVVQTKLQNISPECNPHWELAFRFLREAVKSRLLDQEAQSAVMINFEPVLFIRDKNSKAAMIRLEVAQLMICLE